MVANRRPPVANALWRRRLVEWGVVVAIVLAFLGAFNRQEKVLQGKSEFVAVKSTLGALRTALVIDHLQQKVHASSVDVALVQRNPFLLLQSLPPNYAGEVSALQIGGSPPGSWVFDADCSCIGYQPIYRQWLEGLPDTEAVWFKVGSAAGPLTVTAMGAYVWQGQALD